MANHAHWGWYGVDLDGTLAYRDKTVPYDPAVIGAPLQPMVMRIKYWLSVGIEVRIFTARMSENPGYAQHVIQEWLVNECGLPRLKCTNVKDYKCVAIWDDIAVRVVNNTGEPSERLP